jgi:D-sedoheptulose 7-phosphate isomerase
MAQLRKALDSIEENSIDTLTGLILTTQEKGGTIYIFGNGDSASNATHFAADFSKGIITPGQKRFRVHSLNMNIPLMTAWSNDESYDSIFKEQLVDVLRPGDLVMGISTSGNSPNVLRAMEYANSIGAITVGLTAFQGGKLAAICKHAIIARTDNVEIAEDVHWVIGHLLKVRLLRRFHGLG